MNRGRQLNSALALLGTTALVVSFQNCGEAIGFSAIEGADRTMVIALPSEVGATLPGDAEVTPGDQERSPGSCHSDSDRDQLVWRQDLDHEDELDRDLDGHHFRLTM